MGNRNEKEADETEKKRRGHKRGVCRGGKEKEGKHDKQKKEIYIENRHGYHNSSTYTHTYTHKRTLTPMHTPTATTPPPTHTHTSIFPSSGHFLDGLKIHHHFQKLNFNELGPKSQIKPPEVSSSPSHGPLSLGGDGGTGKKGGEEEQEKVKRERDDGWRNNEGWKRKKM